MIPSASFLLRLVIIGVFSATVMMTMMESPAFASASSDVTPDIKERKLDLSFSIGTTPAPTKNPTAKPTNPPTLAPTKDPTAAPTKNPTAQPTNPPTLAPTKDPTAAPTKNPTAKPTDSPTLAPTKNPTAAPTKNPCPDDLELVGHVGKKDIDLDRVVKIVSQDTSTVKVALTQGWDRLGNDDTPIDHIFYSYREDLFDEKCYEETSVMEGTTFDTVTIQCHVYKPNAVIKICVADDLTNGLLTVEDDATVPKCCHPTFEPDTPTVCYTIKINCVTECVEEENDDDKEIGVHARGLRGSY